jgi:hypothetical protein
MGFDGFGSERGEQRKKKRYLMGETTEEEEEASNAIKCSVKVIKFYVCSTTDRARAIILQFSLQFHFARPKICSCDGSFPPQKKTASTAALSCTVFSAPKSQARRKRSQREGEKKPVTVSQRQSTHILITILPADSVSFESFFLYLHRKVVEWCCTPQCVIWTFFLAVFSRRL